MSRRGRFASGPPYYIITVVAQASVSRQSIEQALAALDALAAPGAPLAGPDGDEALAQAVAVARTALRLALAADPPPEPHAVAVLIADLSGYTAIAERMDAEQVREAMNAMWLELDGVIAAWGGRIDQHAGDSLVGLFGQSVARPSDAWRAVQAAEALQLALASFNERVRQGAGTVDAAAWRERWPGPQMRVGVHLGPVENGERGAVMGETFRIARELEEAAPPGATLVSPAVHARVQHAFRLQPPRPRRGRQPAYVVGPPKPVEPLWSPGEVVDGASRLVGRTDALESLSDAFQRAAGAHTIEIVTVVADPGVGKTRLLHEFRPRLHILAPDIQVFYAQPAAGLPPRPYAVLCDLIARRLSLYPAHSAAAVRGRIAAAGLLARLPDNRITHAATLERLLMPGDEPPPPLSEVAALARALLVDAAGSGAVVVAIDDLHHADPYSLVLLDQLLHEPPGVPVLVLAFTEPSLLAQPAAAAVSWLVDLTDPFLPASRLALPPLSPVESRLLVADLLRPAAPLPQRLIDLIVADAGGNPWFIEEMVWYLMDLAIIAPGTRWRFDLARADTNALPRTPEALAVARRRRLPWPDGTVLDVAAVAGDAFTDATLFEPLAGVVAEAGVLAALGRLVASGWLATDDRLSRGEAQGFVFARPLVRRAIAAAAESRSAT